MPFLIRGAVRRAWSSAVTYARALGPTNSRAFVIVGLGRSGSTLLTELLGCHPQIRCEQEVLRTRRLSPYMYVTGRRNKRSVSVYGFKVKVWHLSETQGIRKPDIFFWLLHRDGWKFIHLWRRNVLRAAFSLLVARENRRFHVEDAREQENLLAKSFTLRPEDVLGAMHRLLGHREEENRLMKQIPHIEVIYEDDLLNSASWQGTANRIFDYVNVDACSVHSQLKRTSGGRIRDRISNFDDIATEVRKAGYGEYLKTFA